MLPLFVQALIPAEARIASLVGIINRANMAATAIGSVAIGRYAPRWGTKRVLLVCLGTAAACQALQGLSNNPMQLLLARALDGFVIGGVLVTLSTALADAAPDGRQGAVFGLQSTVVSGSQCHWASLGAAVAASWGLRMPFAVATMGFLLAVGMMAVMGKPQSTQRAQRD